MESGGGGNGALWRVGLDPSQVLNTITQLSQLTQLLQQAEDQRIGLLYSVNWRNIFVAVKLFEQLRKEGMPLHKQPKKYIFR
jgi:hypothetical protein